jgi:hypothetical protein
MKKVFISILLLLPLFSNAAVFTIFSGGSNGSNLRYYINIASAGDTIYIDNTLSGITLDMDEILIDKPLSIIGTVHTQYIERNNSSGTPAFRILRFVNCGYVYLKNLEIYGGSTSSVNSVPMHGGAMLISDTNCHVYLESCIIRSNKAADGTMVNQPSFSNLPGGGNGGAICNYGRITLKSCVVYNNSAGKGGVAYYPIPQDPTGNCLGCPGGNGGAICNFGRADLMNSIFTGNKTGNGGYFSDIWGYFSCSGDGGSGGAIYNSSNADLYVANCLFDHNSPGTSTYMYHGQGGAIFNSGQLNVISSTFSIHAFSDDDSVNMNQNSLAKGSTSSVFCSYGSITALSNSILFNSSGGSTPDLYIVDTNSLEISYSLVRKSNLNILQGGNNLYGIDPLFGSTADHHLLFNSPCINQGNPDGTNLTETDLDGHSRIVENITDMGAYEFQGMTKTTSYQIGMLNLFPNPSSGVIYINTDGLKITEFLTVTISNLPGKTLFQEKFFYPESTVKIDLPSRIDNGVYVIHISTEKSNFLGKLIICR